jgi:hypothetical protein
MGKVPGKGVSESGKGEVKNTTRKQEGRIVGNNPKGIGGFGDNPQNRNSGRWRKDDSISYQYHKLLTMSKEELEDFEPETVAQKIALTRVTRAMRSDEDGLKETREVTDRTEGKPKQSVDLDASEGLSAIIKGFVIPTIPMDMVDEDIRNQGGELDK